ncbi:MAG: hypothetical protein ABR530_06085 [Pyrinomonadaceae bacterium]
MGELLVTDGIPGQGSVTKTKKDSPRARGVKQGLFLMLLTIIFTPVFGIFVRFGLNMMPWPIGVFLFLFGGGAVLRIAYALLFESSEAPAFTDTRLSGSLPVGQSNRELSPTDVASFILPTRASGTGSWLDTKDLQPNSVTDGTTQLLEKEKE